MKGVRPGWAVKVIVVILLTSTLFRCVSAATNHSVGGPSGWDLASNIDVWSRSTTFFTGDNLVFRYGPRHDVLEVDAMDFSVCRTIQPIITHTDGETVVPLTVAGFRYFICGRQGHCTMGLRLRVQVLALDSAPPPPTPPAPIPASPSSGITQPPSQGDESNRHRRHPPPTPQSPPHSHPPPPPPQRNSSRTPPPPPPNEAEFQPPPVELGPGLSPLPRYSSSSSAVNDNAMMIMLTMFLMLGGFVQ